MAAPRFPLSSSATPGGPDGGDVVNQPADMSFVIDSVLALDAQPTGTLAGLVDRNEIGAAGHSNGAITVLGLVANTCCRDPRVKAAVVMAGTTEGFGSGTYDLPSAPPLLLVHGTADELVPYRSAVLVFDQARGPKGLLTIHGGSHQSAAGLSAASAAEVMATTTDFFDAYLRHQPGAAAGIGSAGTSRATSVTFDADGRLAVPPSGSPGSGRPSSRDGGPRHRALRRADADDQMEWLHPREGGERARVLEGRHRVGGLVRV